MSPARPRPTRPAEHRRLRALRRRRDLRDFASAISVGVLLMLLVAAAIADRPGPLPFFVLGVSALALGALYFAFPHGPQFSLGASTGLAMYACLYVVMRRAAFPDVPEWALPIGHALPIVIFVTTCLLRRDTLRRFAQQGERGADLAHLADFTRWLAAAFLVGAISLSAPINRLSPDGQALVLLGSMAAIGVISATAAGDVIRLLVDIAVIFQTMTRRLQHLVVPMAAYTSLWALLAVVFGCAYRIADGLSKDHLFHGEGGPIRLTFADALHFSVVTLSTVGYGDILPRDDGIRLLASIEMLLAQLLLLFGFVEIMRGTGSMSGTEPAEARPPARRHPAQPRPDAVPGDETT